MSINWKGGKKEPVIYNLYGIRFEFTEDNRAGEGDYSYGTMTVPTENGDVTFSIENPQICFMEQTIEALRKLIEGK